MPAAEALSGSQFGQQRASLTPPQAHSAADNIRGTDFPIPLPESAETQGSDKSRAAWRAQGVLPYSKATKGTTFNPNA